MGRKIRTYSRITEAKDMIDTLYNNHSEAFWCIKPEAIAVMGIDNVQRSEKAIVKNPLWSKMRSIKGVEQAIFKENNIQERYIIEIFWSDYNEWNEATKAAVLARHLFEITPDVESKNRPDCVGFKILYDVLGVNWERNTDSLPNLLKDEVKFNEDLRPGLEELEALEEDEMPDNSAEVI